MPPRRLKRALTELLRQLPADRPLSGVRISAESGRVVVRDRDSIWQPESGQLLLDFTIDELTRQTRAAARVRAAAQGARRRTEESAADWFDRARQPRGR